MVCPKCGTVNKRNNWRCQSCSFILREIPRAAQTEEVVFQSPLRQAQKANISPVDMPSFSERVEAAHQKTRSAPRRGENLFEEPKKNGPSEAPESMVANNRVQSRKRRNRVFVVVGALALLALATGLFQLSDGENDKANRLFTQAEKAYVAGNHTAALAIFQEFSNQYPQNHLTGIARSRVEEITGKLQAEQARRQSLLIGDLLEKSRAARAEKRYLIPEENNVIVYTDRILDIDPGHREALAMQAEVVKYYQEKAERAEQRRRYGTAIKYYRNVLEILPGDEQTQEKLSALLNR